MLTEQDDWLIRRETAIPGFRSLLHPGRLAALLESGYGISGVQDLRLNYLRYKPGMNCIARFEILAGGEWSSGYAKALGAAAGVKLQKVRGRLDCSGPLGPSRIMLDAEQIMVCFFPNDAKLRSLCRLAERRSREELLSRVFKSHRGWEEAEFTPLNYKPERRFVARFTNPAGECTVLKFYSQSEFEKVREFRKHLSDPAGVRIQKWIGGSKKHHVLAFSWLPGPILREHLDESGLDAVHQAGEAIAHFHQSAQARLRKRNPWQKVSELKALARNLGNLMPELEPAGELSLKLGHWWLAQDGPVLPIHGDFHDKQVVVGDDGVSLIDFDNAHLGDTLSDIGSLIAHWERNAINHQMEAGDIPAMASAFLDGYQNIRPGLNTHELNRYIALSLFQLLHQPFRDRMEDWPEQTSALLRRCSELFGSVESRTPEQPKTTDHHRTSMGNRAGGTAMAFSWEGIAAALLDCEPGRRSQEPQERQEMMRTAAVSPFRHVLEQVEDRLVSTGLRGRIGRVEITRTGSVQLELVLGERRCWYAWEQHELRELEVAKDHRIPLAARLNDAAFAARTSLLSYRPGRRLTLVDRSGQKPRILKGFRRGHLGCMVRKYEVAHAAFAGRGVHAPEVIEYDTDNEALVMVFEVGERLRLSADTTDLFHLIGKGLRDFQDHDALADESVFDSSDELQVIDNRAARLQQVVGEQLPEHWPGLRERLADAWASSPWCK